jgi:AAA+ ATPase superfamily predicted ATPase
MHKSPTLFEISEEEHRQKILLINDQRQWASPTLATYENQFLRYVQLTILLSYFK